MERASTHKTKKTTNQPTNQQNTHLSMAHMSTLVSAHLSLDANVVKDNYQPS